MANYNVYIQYNGGKGNTVAFEFPDGNTTGTGTSSGNPLEVDVNDTVTFIAQGGPGRVTVSGLDIFTTNTDFQIAWDGNGLGLPSSETRTVASGGLTSDTIDASVSSGAVDNYYFERQAVTGTLSPASFATTESQGGVTVTANVSVTGTYYWDLERNAGEPTGANSFGFNAPTFGSLSLTANTNQDFTTGAPNQSGGSTSNIGYQGVSFTIDLFTGASRTGTLLDTSNWTIYETITGLSVGSSSINLGSGTSTFSQNVTTNWRGSDTVSLRIRNTTLSTTVDSFSTSNGSTTLSRTGITGPPQGTTYNYRVEAFNGNAWLTNGPTFSVSRDAAAPDAPTDIAFGADPGTESATVSITCTASGGGTGTLQVSEDNSTWVANGSSFTFTRNTAKTIYARVNDGGNVSSSYSEANTVGYLLPDRDVNFSIDQSSISSGYAGNVILTVTNGSAGNMYRALRTTGGNAGMGNTGYLSGTTTGTVTIGDAAGELPAEGVTNSYTIQARRAVYAGGDNATWYNTSPLRTFTIARTDGTPNAYTIPDVTNAALGAEQNVNVQITGITESVTVSRTSGTATFAVSSTSTTPSSGFSSTAKQISNNQYLHVKQNSSGTAATTLNSGFSVGGVTDTFSNTTAGAGDVTITIVYDEESNSFLPAPSFSPLVSGQNGLSNGQAYEVTAGTDVIFQNTSDPGSSTVVVSSLNSFTNNNSFNLFQGQSVTRTWASGVLGNSVDTIDLTTINATEQVFLKQPAVPPDTTVSPVTPANRAFNDTATFNVTVNNVTSGETYKITENNFTTSLGSATASGTSVTIPMTIGNAQANTYGNLAVGATKTYEIHASRPTNLGGTGSYVQTNDTFTVTRNVESVSVPTDIAFSDPGTNDDNVNITVTASGGSGGTLQVSDDNTNWDANGTAYAAIRGTQGTYYARRLGSQGASVSTTRTENYTPPYRSPDSSITLSGTANNATISPGATASLTLTISNGGSLDEYRVLTTDTNTPLASGASVGSRTGNGNITIASGEQPDVQGTSAGYKVQVRRPTASGGNNTYADTGDTFTITRQAISAPTDIAFGSDPGTADELVSITATASGGANGTIQLSEVSNFATTVSNGSSFTFTRGTAKTIYSRRLDGSVASGTYSEAFTASYLSPDTSITTIGTQDLASGATSFNITIANGSSNTVYEVRSGSYSGTIEGSRTGNGTLTVSDAPAVGATKTYYITAYRTTGSGGDGSTRSNIQTFSAARDASTPTDITFGADPGTRDELVSISCTASGGSGGNLEVSQDNTNWFNSPQNFTFTRGTAKTIYARRNATGGVSGSYSEAFTASYIAPDTTVAVSIVSNSISPGHTANITANISGGTQGDQIDLRTDDTNTPLASGTSVGTATFNSSGNASITISSGEQPTLETTANTATYRAFVRTPTGSGGDNAYDTTTATDTITRQIHTAPTDLVLGTDPGTADEIVSISVTASGGTYGTLQVSGDNTNWVANGSSFNFARGTGRTIYARRLDGTVASASYSEVLTAPYLLPDLSVSASNVVIAFSATFATTVISDGSTTDTYAVRFVNGATTLGSRVGNGALSFSNGIPDVGDTSTYEIYARRPTTTGGDGSTYYDTNVQFTVERTVESVTPPTDIQFTDPGTEDDNVLIAAAGIGGSGGTVKVSESESSGYVTNNSSFSFIRGTAKTIYTRREGSGANSTPYSESYTPAYRTPDSNITTSGTAKNATISPGATANLTLTISNGGTLDQYRILTTDTNTPLASGASVGSITGNGNITISSGEQPDVQGTAAGYKIQVRRPTASGGNNTYADTGDTFTITRQAISAPTDIKFSSDPGTAAATVAISASAIGGANGTIQLSETSNFATTVSNGSSFTFTRGTAKTIYARRIDGAVTSGTYSEANTVGYLLPDTQVAASNDTIAFDATSATTTLSNATAGETYAVRLNDGSTNIATRTGNGDITFTSSLPTTGNTTTYEIFSRRPVSAGGDGSTFYETDDTFTVTRNAESVTAPTNIDFTDPGTNDDNVNITVSASGGTGGTLVVSNDNSTFVANGTAFAAIRGTQATYYARREGTGANSSSYSENYTPPYRAPDTSITATPAVTTISPGSTASVNVTIAGCDNAFDRYQIVTTDTNTPLAFSSSVGSRVSNGDIGLDNGELPDGQGTSAGYKVLARRPTANGGSNVYVDTGVTFTISRQAISAPDDIVFSADPGTAAATVSITADASGGANGTIQLSETSNFATTVANGSSFTFTRGTAKTIYARRIDGAVTSTTYSEANTIGYLLPDSQVAGTSSQIAFNATSATTTISGVARSTDTVAVRLNDGSTNIATRDGNGDITFTSSLPSVGNTTTYELFTRRAVSTGGDGSTFYQTDDTFTVERLVESLTAPDDIVFGADPGTEAATVSITADASGGSGGTLKVSETAAFTTSLANGSSFTFTRGTAKTIYARREGTGANSSNYSEANTVPFLDPVTSIDNIQNQNYLNGTGNTSFDIVINNGNSNTTYQVRTGSNSGTIVTSRVGDGTITVNQFPSDNSQTTYYLTAFRSTSSGGGGSGVVSAIQTFVVSATAQASGNDAGGATGTSDYGFEVYGPDGETIVWGTNNRQTNLQVLDVKTFTSSDNSKFYACPDANDNSKVVVSVGVPNPTTGPIAQRASEGVVVTKTSTGFTVTVNGLVASTPGVTQLTVRSIAARIA